MPFSCDVNDLISNSKCFEMFCMGEEMREAIEIYVRIQNLAASGGDDYSSNLTALLEAAKVYQALSCEQRKAISLWIDMQNAIDNGASISSDVNDLTEAAKCYLCLGDKTKKNVLLFLKCAINTLGKPD